MHMRIVDFFDQLEDMYCYILYHTAAWVKGGQLEIILRHKREKTRLTLIFACCTLIVPFRYSPHLLLVFTFHPTRPSIHDEAAGIRRQGLSERPYPSYKHLLKRENRLPRWQPTMPVPVLCP